MATWAIGDVQGCNAELGELLEAIDFQPGRDVAWFAGDLVNRGPDSLGVLRRVRALGTAAVVILGNHDLHLLACRWGTRKPNRKDTLDAVLAAPDCDDLLEWLCGWPLLHVDTQLGAALVHAGIAPDWDVATARALAGEVEAALQGAGRDAFLADMYGNQPPRFSPDLTGHDRLRTITNMFTRVRVCHADGALDFKFKLGPAALPADDVRRPWFELLQAWPQSVAIYFGHWASLGTGEVAPGIHALDSGCFWGGELTAQCVEDGRRVCVPSQQPGGIAE